MENNIVDIKVLEEKQKVANHRIDNLERKVEDLVDFKYTVNALSNTVNDLKQTVDKIVNQDGNTYRDIKKTILSFTITTVLGAVLGVVLSKLF